MPSPAVEDRYDLIWVGSVFTHLPESDATLLLEALSKALKPLGVLIFTTGGRLGVVNLGGYLANRDDNKFSNYNMTDDAIKTMLLTWKSANFGYADYHNRAGYGGALIKPEWVHAQMTRDNLVQIFFQEMGWDTHQDVYAYMQIGKELAIFGKSKGAYY